jgi:tetratricopeptide (TPR) repeat protein
MSAFKPKEILASAQAAEAKGDGRSASNQYALLSVYLRRKEKFKEAKLLICRAIQLSTKSARLYVQRALIEHGLGNSLEARAAIDLFSHYAMEKKNAESYGRYLDEHASTHPDWRQMFYEAVLQIDRTRSWPLIGLARAFEAQENSAGAEKALLEALQTKDDLKAVKNELLRLWEGLGKADAIASLQRMEDGKITPDEFLLLVSGKQKSRTKAQPRPMEIAPPPTLACDERDLKSLIFDLEKELGVELENKRDSIEPLLKEFRSRAQEVLGEDERGHLDMALAYYEMELFQASREEIQYIKETSPFYVEAQCLLAEVYRAEGAELQSLDVYQKCLRDPNLTEDQSVHCMYQLAQLFIRLGDPKKATSLLEGVEKIDPTYRDLRALTSSLKRKAS